MKVIKKLFLVLITLISCQNLLTASTSTYFSQNYIDTIPQVEPEYKGNRLMVKSIKVLKKKGKSIKIQYKLVNNGRNKIKLGKPSNIPKDLIVQFDNSLIENNLVDAKNEIIEGIKKQSISLRPGQLIMGNKIKFTHLPIPPSDRIAAEEKIVDPFKEIEKEEIVEEPISKSKFDEAVKDIVQEVPLPDAELENPREPNSSSKTLEEEKVEKTDLVETILVKENETTDKLEIEETESILEVIPSVDANSKKVDVVENVDQINTEIIEEPEVIEVAKIESNDSILIEKIEETEIKELVIEENTKIENLDNQGQNEIVEIEKVDSISTEISVNSEPNDAIVEDVKGEENLENQNPIKKKCADLIIENVEVIKKNKRYVQIKYTIKNIGNIPISLHGESKKELDNIAIQSHFTRSHKMTRGAIPVDISYIKKASNDINGMMVPGESVTLKLKVETLKMTKFSPVLALTLNPSSANFECSKFNNIYFIDIAEKAPASLKSGPQKPLEDETAEKVSTLEN